MAKSSSVCVVALVFQALLQPLSTRSFSENIQTPPPKYNSVDGQYMNSQSGTYNFRYDTGGGAHQSFRTERRDAEGRVSGYFGYVDPTGVLRVTYYVADEGGYRQRTVLRHRVLRQGQTPEGW